MLNETDFERFKADSDAKQQLSPEAHYLTWYERFSSGLEALLNHRHGPEDRLVLGRLWAGHGLFTYTETLKLVPRWALSDRRPQIMRALNDLQKRMRQIVPPYQDSEETVRDWVREQRQNPEYELPTLLFPIENQLQFIIDNRHQGQGPKGVFRQFFREYPLFLMMILGYLEHLNDPSQSLERVLNQPFVAHYREGQTIPLFHFILKQVAETANTPKAVLTAVFLYSMLDWWINPSQDPVKWMLQFLKLVLASQICRLVADHLWDANGLGPALEQRVQRQVNDNFNTNPALEHDLPWNGMAP